LLLYTSSFLNELIHPELQYGSSIMAAKTNPVILEPGSIPRIIDISNRKHNNKIYRANTTH
jgi:fumarate hydratase class II